jgi:hypothetical protein
LSFLASPAFWGLLVCDAEGFKAKGGHTWSEALPVRLPITDSTAPEAESMYDWRVEVFLSDMIAGCVFGCLCCCVFVSASLVLEVVIIDQRIKSLPLQ